MEKPLTRKDLAAGETVCPECGHRVRTYQRTITSAMAVALLLLYRHRSRKGEWTHLPSLKMRVRNPRLRAALAGGDTAKLRYWGLIEYQPGTRADGSSRTGLVRITKSGESFCRRRLLVERSCAVRLGVPVLFYGPMMGVIDALRNKFDYEAILR